MSSQGPGEGRAGGTGSSELRSSPRKAPLHLGTGAPQSGACSPVGRAPQSTLLALLQKSSTQSEAECIALRSGQAHLARRQCLCRPFVWAACGVDAGLRST